MKPFLLRRTKGEVEADLPAKTEIVQRVVLEGDQRDLYETLQQRIEHYDLAVLERMRSNLAPHPFVHCQTYRSDRCAATRA